MFTKCAQKNFSLHLRFVMVMEAITVKNMNINIKKTLLYSMLLFQIESYSGNRCLPFPESSMCLYVLHIVPSGNIFSYPTYRQVD